MVKYNDQVCCDYHFVYGDIDVARKTKILYQELIKYFHLYNITAWCFHCAKYNPSQGHWCCEEYWYLWMSWNLVGTVAGFMRPPYSFSCSDNKIFSSWICLARARIWTYFSGFCPTVHPRLMSHISWQYSALSLLYQCLWHRHIFPENVRCKW